MGPSQGLGEQGNRGIYSKRKRKQRSTNGGKWEQRKFWGTGDIENEDFDLGEQGNKATYFRGTREQVSGCMRMASCMP